MMICSVVDRLSNKESDKVRKKVFKLLHSILFGDNRIKVLHLDSDKRK